MLSWYPSTWALSVLDWLAWANDETQGLLEYVLLVMVVAPAVVILFAYLRGGSNSGGDEE